MIVKDYVGQPWFFLFNVTFISFAQSVLLFSVTTPAYVLLLTTRLASAQNEPTIEIGDLISFGVMLVFVGLSAISDQQQWNFQTAKHEYKRTAKIPTDCGYTQEELERGFLTKGLFGVSRHPNFAAEQAVWVTLHAWSCYSTGLAFNWSGVGAVAYLFLFQGSTWLTELLSQQKYPEYAQYKKQVGMFFPKPNAKPPTFTTDGTSGKQVTNGAINNKDAQKARERYNLR